MPRVHNGLAGIGKHIKCELTNDAAASRELQLGLEIEVNEMPGQVRIDGA